MSLIHCTGLLVVGLVATTSICSATEISGKIEAVQDDGKFVFSDGRILQQWGIEITDVPDVNRLVTGKRADCLLLSRDADISLADCRISSSGEMVDFADTLSLFTWLPVLSWAKEKCSTDEFEETARRVRGFGQVKHACDAGKPIRFTRY